MQKLHLILPITAALLLAGQVAAAPDYGNKGNHPSAKILKKLELTDEQKADMRTLRQQGKQDRLVFKQDMENIEQQLKTVIRAPEWNDQAATALLSQRYEIEAKLALTRATSKNAMWNSLSDEQQEKLADRSEGEHKKGKGEKGEKRKAMWNNLSDEQKEKLADRSEREHKKGKGEKGEKRHALRRFKGLNLTDDQRQAIATIIQQQRTDNSALFASKKEFGKQQKELIHAKNFDNEAWQQLEAQQREIDLSLGLAMAYGRHQIWNQLDETQQAKMDNMAERSKDRMKKHAHDRT